MANPESDLAAAKAEAQTIEHSNPYAMLSPEDADFMRQYEGKPGEKVISKVRQSLLGSLQI